MKKSRFFTLLLDQKMVAGHLTTILSPRLLIGAGGGHNKGKPEHLLQ